MLLHGHPQSMLGMYLYYIMTAGGDTQGGGDYGAQNPSPRASQRQK